MKTHVKGITIHTNIPDRVTASVVTYRDDAPDCTWFKFYRNVTKSSMQRVASLSDKWEMFVCDDGTVLNSTYF